MGRYGVRSKLAGVPILLALLALTVAASPAAALTKPERKAVDVKKVEATAGPNATLVEIRFKGDIAEELGTGGLKKALATVELRSATGPTTTITDRKSSKKPKEKRTGTSGPFNVVRNEKASTVLVEQLPGPIEEVEVTTSGPAGKGSRSESRGVSIQTFDNLVSNVGSLDSPADIRAEIDDAEDRIDELEQDGSGDPEDREEIETLEGWVKYLDSVLAELPPAAQCNDGLDNDNDGDYDFAPGEFGSDAGCVSADDNDEKDVALPVTCPAQGARTSPFVVINTPQSNAFTSLLLRTASSGQGVLNSPVAGTSSPPAPLPGNICGPGVDVTYQWVVFTDGDPFSLPDPPPGDHGFCLFLDVRNPAGSGIPGGQDASLVFAVGTTAQ
jgi:hypothetical protein